MAKTATIATTATVFHKNAAVSPLPLPLRSPAGCQYHVAIIATAAIAKILPSKRKQTVQAKNEACFLLLNAFAFLFFFMFRQLGGEGHRSGEEVAHRSLAASFRKKQMGAGGLRVLNPFFFLHTKHTYAHP